MIRIALFTLLLGVGSFKFGQALATDKPPKIVPLNEEREMPIIVDRSPKKTKIKVMVIDTGIASHPWLDQFVQRDESKDYKDTVGHGTHVAGIIAFGNDISVTKSGDQLCPEVEIYSCAFWTPDNESMTNLKNTLECINKATAEKMDYINYSGGGTLPFEEEYLAYKKFVDQGGTVVAAAGNERSDLTKRDYYPASYAFGWTKIKLVKKPNEKNVRQVRIQMPKLKNIFIAENVDRAGKLHRLSNFHPDAFKERGVDILSTLPNGQFGYMTGTSQAAPALLHTILKQKCEQNSDLRHASK